MTIQALCVASGAPINRPTYCWCPIPSVYLCAVAPSASRLVLAPMFGGAELTGVSAAGDTQRANNVSG